MPKELTCTPRPSVRVSPTRSAALAAVVGLFASALTFVGVQLALRYA
ncbi:MAG TPA: hypothetical protein VHS27_18580 [Gaiellales bacterium]|nr:hypothetical protein [Gaiellales bacterium]